MSNADYLYIGAYQDPSGQAPAPTTYFDGDIADVRIYDRALSSSEIISVFRTNQYGTSQPSLQYLLSTFIPGWQPLVTSINMDGYGGANDCIAYIQKLVQFASNSPSELFISASAASGGGYKNTNWYAEPQSGVFPESSGFLAPIAGGTVITDFASSFPFTCSNLAGFYYNGTDGHGSLAYATNGSILFTGSNGWYLIETEDSYNGVRSLGQGNFLSWFAANAFRGTNYDYQATPIGAVCHTDEPIDGNQNDGNIYFDSWAAGKPFGICAWVSRRTPSFQAVGDPFVKR